MTAHTGDLFIIRRVDNDVELYRFLYRKDAISKARRLLREERIRTYVIDFKGNEVYSYSDDLKR